MKLRSVITKSLSVLGLLFIVIFSSGRLVYAAEINPDPATYSYGSTSEYSPSDALQVIYSPNGAGSAAQLANTGDHFKVSTVIIDLMAVSGIGLVVYLTIVAKKYRRYYRLNR